MKFIPIQLTTNGNFNRDASALGSVMNGVWSICPIALLVNMSSGFSRGLPRIAQFADRAIY
jgi:hypothetical protein